MNEVQNGGLGSLIPKKQNENNNEDPQNGISFPLPDISGGQTQTPMSYLPTGPTQIYEPSPRELTVDAASPSEASQKKSPESIFHIDIDKVSPNPHQPRKDFAEDSLRELANSIREFGILQPLVVSKIELETDYGTDVRYELIAGERRLMAAKMLGLPTVPAIIKSAPREVEKLEMAIIENIQRADLNPIESARAMARLQDEFGMTQREIASRLGKSREAVANTMRLLGLPSALQEAIVKGAMGESQGRMLLSIEDPGTQERIFNQIIKDNLSVRQLEAVIRKNKEGVVGAGPSRETHQSIDPDTAALRDRLEEFLGTKVDVLRDGKTGKIVINFYSQEELNSVLQKFFRQIGNQF